MSNKNSRNDMLTADQNLIDGIQKHEATLPATVTAGSQTITLQDMVTLLQGRITTGKAVVQAESARTAAVKADRDKRAQTQPQVRSFTNLIVAMYEGSPDVLGDYGLTAPKPRTQSVQGKADAAAKAAATRKLLGTKGTQQKKAAKAAAEAAPAVPAQPVAPEAQPGAPVAALPAPAKQGS